MDGQTVFVEGDNYSSKVGLIVSYSAEKLPQNGIQPVAALRYRQRDRRTHTEAQTDTDTHRQTEPTERDAKFDFWFGGIEHLNSSAP